MKKLIIIIAVLFTSVTFAQECNLTLRDILSIDSQKSFERLLIENNFERLSHTESEVDNLTKAELVYGLNLTKDENGQYRSPLWAAGEFYAWIESSDINTGTWRLVDVNYDETNSFYNRIFNEVKQKCKFYKIESVDKESISEYICPDTSFDGRIGFHIFSGNGEIIILPSNEGW